MNIHAMAVIACIKLQNIPRYIKESQRKDPRDNAIDSLRTIVYVQQSRIEALERAVNRLASISSPRAIQEIQNLLVLTEPDCGDEPDDDAKE